VSVPLLYIAAYARSGSTLLGELLARRLGGVHVGEVRHLAERALLPGRRCSCGAEVVRCPFWSRALAEAGLGGAELAELRALARALRRPAAKYLLSAAALEAALTPSRRLLLVRLYRGLARAAEGRLLVDGSKQPAYAWALARSGAARVHLVHLLRDPRAVAYAVRHRRKPLPQGGRMASAPLLETAVKWRLLQGAILRLGPALASYHRQSYEALCRDPEAALARLRFLARGGAAGASHLFSGNPDFLAPQGGVEIRFREPWRAGMGWWEAQAVRLLAGRVR